MEPAVYERAYYHHTSVPTDLQSSWIGCVPLLLGGVLVDFEDLTKATEAADRIAMMKSEMSPSMPLQIRVTREHVSRIIAMIGEEAEIVVPQDDPRTGHRQKLASAHDIRRGCARRLINMGVSAETLKVIMRHSSFSTTEKHYGALRTVQSAAAEVDDKLTNARRRCISGGISRSPAAVG